MFILLTNDDGYFAEGLQALYSELNKKHEVVIVAPDRERSATSHAITLRKKLLLQKIDKNIFAISGTPTDCVMLALHGHLLNAKPDLIISGINHGQNLGFDVTYSGTVGAAMEGAIMGIPSFAISVQRDKTNSGFKFEGAVKFALKMIDFLRQNSMSRNTFFNINLPSINEVDLRGVKITRLGRRIYKDIITHLNDEEFIIGGSGPYWEEINNGQYTDFHAVAEGYISVTPLKIEWTNNDAMKELVRDGVLNGK